MKSMDKQGAYSNYGYSYKETKLELSINFIFERLIIWANDEGRLCKLGHNFKSTVILYICMKLIVILAQLTNIFPHHFNIMEIFKLIWGHAQKTKLSNFYFDFYIN